MHIVLKTKISGQTIYPGDMIRGGAGVGSVRGYGRTPVRASDLTF